MKRRHGLWAATITILLSFVLSYSGIANAIETTQPQPTQVAVVIDGRPIFRLGPAGEFSAQIRAQQANQQLALLIAIQKTPIVEVQERNQQPTILANGQYLLTVTGPDTAIATTPWEQAQTWAKQLEAALNRAQQERTPEYIRRSVTIALVAFGLTLLSDWLINHFGRRSLTRVIRRLLPQVPKTGTVAADDLNFLLKVPLVLLRMGLWSILTFYILGLFPDLRQQRYQLMSRFASGFQMPLFSLGERAYTVVDIFILLGLLWGLFTLVQTSTDMLKVQILRRAGIAPGAQQLVASLYKYSVLFIGGIVLLQIWGVDLRSLALIGSALGVGIGFGLQDIVRNFISGFVLLFERSVQVGDLIEIDQRLGLVEHMGARSIVIKTLDQVSVIVPNSRLIDSHVTNWHHQHPASRLHLPVNVAYTSDPQLVKTCLLQVAQEHPAVVASPSPAVFFKGFGDSALLFELLVWIMAPEQQQIITSDLYFRIAENLQQYHIQVPFPQRDLHLSSGHFPLTLSPELEIALAQFLKKYPENTDKL